MSGYVLDTHAVVRWFTRGQARLGANARAAFETAEAGRASLHAPAPVVLETWFLAKAGRLRMKTTLGAWWRDLERAGVILEPLRGEDVIAAHDLDWDHGDVYDRLIVATALRLELPLVTADDAIAAWGGVDVVW